MHGSGFQAMLHCEGMFQSPLYWIPRLFGQCPVNNAFATSFSWRLTRLFCVTKNAAAATWRPPSAALAATARSLICIPSATALLSKRLGKLCPVTTCPTKFGTMTWYIWKCRNTFVFQGKDNHPDLPRLVASMASAYRSSMLSPSMPGPTPPPMNRNRGCNILNWERPPSGWISLCVDGCSKGNPGPGGGGGVFRDHSGGFLGAFSFRCGECDALRAELWALFHGLNRATELGLTQVVVECDALEVVKAIQATSLVTHPHLALLESLQELLQWPSRLQNQAHQERGEPCS